MITLTIPAICADIYARSALHHLDPATTPTLLTADSAPALEQLVSAELDTLALILDATVTHAGSTATVNLRLIPSANPGAVASALERYIALRILAEAVFSTEPRYAENLLAAADSTLNMLRCFVASVRTSFHRRIPHYFVLFPLFSLLLW